MSKRDARHQLCSLRLAESKDDLRLGMFTITADDRGRSPEPDVHHVVVDQVRGSVTWRYPEPRAVSPPTVPPVPFLATSFGRLKSRCAYQCSHLFLQSGMP